MSRAVTILPEVTREEISLQNEIIRLMQNGESSQAVIRYRFEWARGLEIVSAYTHFLVHLAGCDSGMEDDFLKRVRSRAEGCRDYAVHKLNIRRDRAVRLAEVRPKSKRDFEAALAASDIVINTRRDEEGEDSPELQNDKVARGKILVLANRYQEAFEHFMDMRGGQTGQTHLNVEWWLSVAALCAGKYEFASLLAKRNLRPEHGDLKPDRVKAWNWMCRKWQYGSSIEIRYGAAVARVVIGWKL